MTTLFLIRHAPAQPRQAGKDDTRRALTPAGRAKFTLAVAGLRALGVEFDGMFHSPWLRAIETANLLAPLLRGESLVTDRLVQPPDRALLADLKGQRIAVVGHEPWLSNLLALLVLGRAGDAARFELKKGSVARLEGTPRPRGMVLRALWPPATLRRVGRQLSR